MSRSRKKPIIKDKPRNTKASVYYRRIRRAMKTAVKKGAEVIPVGKEIVNDYNYCDYKFDLRKSKDKKWKLKASRK